MIRIARTTDESVGIRMTREERRTVRTALAYWSQRLATQGLGASAQGQVERARVTELLDRIPR